MIWMISTDYEGPTGNRGWSETTKERQPVKNSGRWYSTDADRTDRFGPYAEERKRQVAAHWA